MSFEDSIVDHEGQMKSRKPTAAGIVSVLCGVFTIFYRSGRIIRMGLSWLSLSFDALSIAIGLLAVLGGTFAIRRRRWRLALTGAICAVFPPHPWGIETLTPLLGVLAIVFIVVSRSEFVTAPRDHTFD
jgi:uncharacterized membrane protein